MFKLLELVESPLGLIVQASGPWGSVILQLHVVGFKIVESQSVKGEEDKIDLGEGGRVELE